MYDRYLPNSKYLYRLKLTMCDQTEILYKPGNIVWVKLGPVWWPGQVQDYEKLPEEITGNFRKKPIAVVKFFQEESFEYVKNINHIYLYNCRRKNEFIKKGLDLYRSSNSRDVPSNMDLFPNDIATAEHLTGGNPNIIKDDEFAPEEKLDYSSLFGPKKIPGKKSKGDSVKKEYGGSRLKSLKDSNGRKSVTVTPPRAITHPRFINKAFHGQSDHEVRIRHQSTSGLRDDDSISSSASKQYNCHVCGFTSARLNVIILHNKSHSTGFGDTYLATKASELKRPKLKDYSVPTSVVKSRVKSTPRRLLLGTETPKRKKERSPKESKIEKSIDFPSSSTPKKDKAVVQEKVSPKKSEVKRKTVKEKKQKLENEAIRETLLKDWDEDDEALEDVKSVKHDKSDIDEEKGDANEKTEEKEGKSEDHNIIKPQSRLLGKRLRLGKTAENKEELPKGKETSCFDFDDSDEGIKLDKTVMKFGMKIPRVLGDEKIKRKSQDIEQIETNMDENIKESNLEMEVSKENEDEKLEAAFENLLEETCLPVIPDVPKNLFTNSNPEISEKSVPTYEQSIETTDKTKSESEKVDCSKDNQEVIPVTSPESRCDEILMKSHENTPESSMSNTLEDKKMFCNSDVEKIKSIDDEYFEAPLNCDLVTHTEPPVDKKKSVMDFTSTVTETLGKNLIDINDHPTSNDNLVQSNVSVKESETIIDDCEIEESSIINDSEEQKGIDDNVESVEKTEGNTDKVVNVTELNKNDNQEKMETGYLNSESSQLENQEKTQETFKTKIDLQSLVDHIYSEEVPTSQTSNMANDLQAELVEKGDESNHEFESGKFHDLPFDINSMPVIIGEDLIQVDETATSVRSNQQESSSPSVDKKAISNQSKVGENEKVVSGTKVFQSVISVAGKDGQVIPGKPIVKKPVQTVKNIKLPAGSTLKSVLELAKVGSNQVLVLKSGSGQTSKLALNQTVDAGTQKIIQSGGKLLILTNPQTSGQKVLNTQQQVLTTTSNLAPRVRLVPTKGPVVPISRVQTVTVGKTSVQKSGCKGGQKFMISKGNILTTPKNMLIGKSGILTPVTSTTTKGQTFIAQNLITNKGNLIIPSSSTVSSQSITTNKMILTPMTTKTLTSGNQTLRIVPSTAPGDQTLRIVTSTAPVSFQSGTRLIVSQTPQAKVVKVPQQKNQKVNTLFIQTSQEPSSILTSTNQITTKPKLIPINKTVSQIKTQSLPQVISQINSPVLPKKVGIQKVRQSNPNILQKSQKRQIPRVQKNVANQIVVSQAVTQQPQEPIILSSPVVDQSNVIKSGISQSDGTALVYLTVDESGNYQTLTDNSLVSFDGRSQDQTTLYIDPNNRDMDNIFLTIDNAGNLLNISQPQPPVFKSESTIPSQDILAKALANTQVLQQETIIPETSSMIPSSLEHTTAGLNSSFAEQAQYPAPSLSHSVLETSLTLNQPIMTPLEVPSSVSSANISQLASLPSSFIHSNILTDTKTRLIRPSMPLLSEDADNSRQTEPVYLLDSANNIITPVTSGSQLSLQLALSDNVIVSSEGEASLIPSTYQVVTSNILTSPVFSEQNRNFKTENNTLQNINNSGNQTSFIIQSDQKEIISTDYNSGSSESHVTAEFLNDVTSKHSETDLRSDLVTAPDIEGNSIVEQTNDHYINENPTLKRSIEESCDIEMENSSKHMKVEERKNMT
uniref:PWWP domain-containing protein n=4 Tax=Clastoptera arizonana TaxID=38151 RepID=A0A1B6DHS6_9HEMI